MTARKPPPTPDEARQWLERRLLGQAWKTIARDARRDWTTVENHVKRLADELCIALPPKKTQMIRERRGRKPHSVVLPTTPRRCLGGCGRMFQSTGPGHRLCNMCRQRVDRMHDGCV